MKTKKTKRKTLTVRVEVDTYKKLAHKKIEREDPTFNETIKSLLNNGC